MPVAIVGVLYLLELSLQSLPGPFGHGILAGIHWRTDTSSSIQLGEAVAISMLQDRAATYAEKFTINLTKIDGSTATISNQ